VLTLYLALAAAGVAWATSRGDAASAWRVAGREDSQTLLGTVAGVLIGLGFVFASRLAVHRSNGRVRFIANARHARAVARRRGGGVGSGLGAGRGDLFPRGSLASHRPCRVEPGVALLHVGPKLRFLPWTISSLVAGLLFGQLFLWSGDLAGPIAAHFTVNFLNLRFLSAHEMR